MESATADVLCVTTTVEIKEQAEQIARILVERRLAACVQVIGPIQSTYWWDGAVQQSGEWLCLAKTTRQHYGALETAIRELHSYEVPEIIAVPVVAGSDGYLQWLRDELSGGGNP